MKITRIAGKQKPLAVENVEMREPLVGDLISAERISGRTDGVAFTAALISQIATFDGANLPPEELESLSSSDFLALSAELDVLGVATSLPESSISSEKESSEKKES